MIRNWDIIREILLAAESLEPDRSLTLSDFAEDRAFDISYHVVLLDEAGIVQSSISKALGRGPKQFHLYRLTWSGHELLDAIRNESIWKKTKSVIFEKGGVMTFDMVKTVAAGIVKTTLGF